MRPVQSSTVARIGYEEGAEEAYVEFLSGGLYVYIGVPPMVFEDLEHSPSKGKFVNEILKPRYPCQRL